jgi:hypothetical protein
MPLRKSLKRRKSSSKRLSKRLRTMKRNSKRMSRKSMRGGQGCTGGLRKSKISMRGGKDCTRKRSMSGGYTGSSVGYMKGQILSPK